MVGDKTGVWKKHHQVSSEVIMSNVTFQEKINPRSIHSKIIIGCFQNVDNMFAKRINTTDIKQVYVIQFFYYI